MTKLNFKQSILAGVMAAAAAAVINVILFFIFHGAGILTDTIFVMPNQPLTFIPIIISSVVPTLIASLVFFLLEKFTKKGFMIFSILSVILLLLSFVNPFMIVGVTTGYALALDFMHLIVAASVLFFINRANISKNSK